MSLGMGLALLFHSVGCDPVEREASFSTEK